MPTLVYLVPREPHPSWAEFHGVAPHERWEAEAPTKWAGHLVQSPELSSPSPHLQGSPTWTPRALGPAWPPTGPPTVARDTAVLLALLLRVELVAVALAAPVLKVDAPPLGGIERPELDEGSAGPGNYGEVAGRCGGEGGTVLVILPVG